MTQDEKIYKEAAKALIGYYSWHMDELLELYNAMGFPPDGAYIWMDGLHTYFIKL